MRSRRVGKAGEEVVSCCPVGSAAVAASLPWVGAGCRVACASVSRGGEQERLGGAQGPCPTQQATLCDSHQDDPGEHEGTSHSALCDRLLFS